LMGKARSGVPKTVCRDNKTKAQEAIGERSGGIHADTICSLETLMSKVQTVTRIQDGLRTRYHSAEGDNPRRAFLSGWRGMAGTRHGAAGLQGGKEARIEECILSDAPCLTAGISISKPSLCVSGIEVLAPPTAAASLPL
jgi:hypothetical protein